MIAACVSLVVLAACSKVEEPPKDLNLGAPVLTEIAAPQAVATSEVIVDQKSLDEGVIRVMAWGFCYGTSPDPTIHSATVTTIPEKGKVSAVLTGLENNTTYYVRAFATLYPAGMVYSPRTEIVVGFVTEPAE